VPLEGFAVGAVGIFREVELVAKLVVGESDGVHGVVVGGFTMVEAVLSYLLSAVVEKAKKNDVGVFVTYWEDHETKVKMLTGDELSCLMDADPFLSIEGLLSGEGE